MLKSIAFGEGRFVVTTDKDIIYTSTDGITWKKVFVAMAHNLNKVSYLKDQFIAIGNYGTILASPDGLKTWSVLNFTETVDPTLTGLALLPDGVTYIAAGKGIIMTGTDPRRPWDAWTLQAKNILNGVAYANGAFDVGWRQPDRLCGRRMGRSGSPGCMRVLPPMHFKGITFANDRFVAVGGSTTENLIITSDDGITWTEVDFGSCVMPDARGWRRC